MPLEKFASQPVWQESPLYPGKNAAMIRAAEGACNGNESPGFVGKNLPVGIRMGSNTFT